MGVKKIFILGAGAIGSVYGTLLSRKNDVVLIGEKAHVETIRAKGLNLTGDINETFQLEAKTRIDALPPNTLLLLTTKAHQSKKAISEIKKLLKKDTVILVLQNGLGNEDLVRKIVGKRCQVLRGLTLIFAEFLEPGRIKFGNAKTILPLTNNGKRIAEIFRESGLPVKLAKDMKKEIWKKLVVNCLLNPLTALFRVKNNEIWGIALKSVREKIIRECIKVATAEGIFFKKGFEKEIAKKMSFYTNYSSMCQDIIRGRKTEIDFLNGKILELGKKHKIQTPVNELLYYLIKFLES